MSFVSLKAGPAQGDVRPSHRGSEFARGTAPPAVLDTCRLRRVAPSASSRRATSEAQMNSGHEIEQDAAETRDTVHDLPPRSGPTPGPVQEGSLAALLGLASDQVPILFWS